MNPTQNPATQTQDQDRPELEEAPEFISGETRHRNVPPGKGEDFSQGDEPLGDDFIGDDGEDEDVRNPERSGAL